MSWPSGTGYGINPFGKACSPHTSSANTTHSIEQHERLEPQCRKMAQNDVVVFLYGAIYRYFSQQGMIAHRSLKMLTYSDTFVEL